MQPKILVFKSKNPPFRLGLPPVFGLKNALITTNLPSLAATAQELHLTATLIRSFNKEHVTTAALIEALAC